MASIGEAIGQVKRHDAFLIHGKAVMMERRFMDKEKYLE